MTQEELSDAPNHPSQENNHQEFLRLEKYYLGAWLFGTIILVLLSSVWTQSPVFLTFIGFFPLLLTVLLLFVVIEQGYKDVVYWFVPFITAIGFLLIGSLFNVLINFQLNIGALTVVNLVLGLLLVAGLIFTEGKTILPTKEKETIQDHELGEYLHSIEDKCKALNFVIGRVYRMSNGGSQALRARLRIDSEWYNQFQSLVDDPEENKTEAIAVLDLIYDRLSLYLRKEKEVFTEQELKSLKHLARNKDGEDRIIDVLIRNDRDPAESYYVGAVEGARKILETLKQ